MRNSLTNLKVKVYSYLLPTFQLLFFGAVIVHKDRLG